MMLGRGRRGLGERVRRGSRGYRAEKAAAGQRFGWHNCIMHGGADGGFQARVSQTWRSVALAFVVDKQVGKFLLQSANLGAIADLNVRIVGILQRVILVVFFGPIESL